MGPCGPPIAPQCTPAQAESTHLLEGWHQSSGKALFLSFFIMRLQFKIQTASYPPKYAHPATEHGAMGRPTGLRQTQVSK